MGRTGTQRALTALTLVLLPLSLLTGCSSDQPATTVVESARDAVVVAPDGAVSAASAGRALRAGESVRTTAAGAVVLRAGERRSYLGGDGLLVLRSSARAELIRGALIVDTRRAGKAELRVGGFDLALDSSAVTRVERSAAIRVGSLAGAARMTDASGARLDVPAYRQALAVGADLPQAPTPLVLTDDEAERRVVPDLVADDEALLRTAASIDATPLGRALVDLGSLAGIGPGVSSAGPLQPRSAAPSETALPVAIARAAKGDSPTAVAGATRAAMGLRRAGGSWGVVARIVGTSSADVSRAIDALLTVPGTQPPALVPAPGPDSGADGTPGASPQASPRPSGSGPRPSGSPRPSASPSPSPSRQPTVVDDVRELIGRLLPTPTPTPSQSAGQGGLLPIVGGLLNP